MPTTEDASSNLKAARAAMSTAVNVAGPQMHAGDLVSSILAIVFTSYPRHVEAQARREMVQRVLPTLALAVGARKLRDMVDDLITKMPS